jgi:Family of unknown function (DUF6065)
MSGAPKINDENNKVPDNTILIVTDNDDYNNTVTEIVEPLKGKIKRDWFIKHAYWCLPLTIGNQYGFAIKSLYDFEAIWNGGDSPEDVKVSVTAPDGRQFISSHFGMGVITLQNRFVFRTPPGINLVTMNAPNVITPYLQNMTGVIETDNLRRDFTFNIRITVPNVKVQVKKGDIVSCVIPIPRFTIENYNIKLANECMSAEVIANERQTALDFGKERAQVDVKNPHGIGRRYFNGEDVYGNKLPNHQKSMSGEN